MSWIVECKLCEAQEVVANPADVLSPHWYPARYAPGPPSLDSWWGQPVKTPWVDSVCRECSAWRAAMKRARSGRWSCSRSMSFRR